MIKRVAVTALLCLVGQVQAQGTNFMQGFNFQSCYLAPGAAVAGCGGSSDNLKSVLTATSGVVAPVGRSISAIGGGAGIRVTDVATISGGGSARLPVDVSRVFTARALGSALGQVLRNPWLWAGSAAITVLWEVLEEQGVEVGPAGIRVDPGQAGVKGFAWTCKGTGGVEATGSTPVAACAAADKKLPTSCGTDCVISVGSTNCVVSPNPMVFSCETAITYKSPTASTPSVRQSSAYGGDTTICPQTSLAPLRFAYGGPCASDSRIAPTPVQLEDIAAKIPDTDLREIARDFQRNHESGPSSGIGHDIASRWRSDSPVTVTQPKPVTTSEGTTTKPDGTVETKKTEVSCNVTAAGAACKSETKISTPTGTTTETVTKEEAQTDCDKYPDSLGCQKLTDIPDVELPKESRPVTFTPQGGWGTGNAACPPPRQVMVFGHSVVVDNEILCRFFSMARFIIIPAFSLAGLLLFVGGLKQ